MTNVPLTNLGSGYSLLQSTAAVADLVAALRDRGFTVAALTDQETLAGVEEFDRLMRIAGLFPLVGVSRRWAAGGQEREIRLIATDRAGWTPLVRFREWEAQPQSGLAVVLGASPDAWWTSIQKLRDLPLVIVELFWDQRALLEQLPSHWRWVPSARVRCLEPGDGELLDVMAQLAGQPRDPGAEPLPRQCDGWLAPFADWPRDQLWMPHDSGSVFPDRGWKMPKLDLGDESRTLREKAGAGLAERLPDAPGATERLAYELEVIEQLGFPGYFLMVADVVNWARRQGIRVGPGRGSAAGSLVAYALGITDVNPLAFGLLFERFLNPARRTLPDIDLDFEDVRRLEVVQYLRERHGADRVAQIGTYGTFGARAALRDVARVLGLSADAVNRVMKSIDWGAQPTLMEHEVRLRQGAREAGLPEQWIALAIRLEGLPRHRSTHAAGVIISPEPLGDWLLCHGNPRDGWVTDFDMGSVERLGFVKLDVLGLRTLSLISKIEAGLDLPADTITRIDGRDPATLRLLARGDTDGVFQLDGRGVKNLLKQMRPQSLDEVILVVALYRPGPMEAIGEYLRRRASGYRPLPNDPLESRLKETAGIMVYQEQLMEAVQQIGGLSLAEADLVRRAVSKKDHALLAELGGRVMANMVSLGHTQAEALQFWEKIRAFGDYGFNKSHAASYGLLAYYLAYLKAHYPLEFWAAELSNHEGGDKLRDLMVQAVSQGIAMRPPHVNRSQVDFQAREGGLDAGLAMIRGLGLESARKIVQERDKGGLFASAEDVSRRLQRALGMKSLEALESAGALKGLGSVAGLKTTQMQLFEAMPASAPPRIDFEEAFGFGWPEPTGPIFVRLDETRAWQEVAQDIRDVASAMPGAVPVSLIRDAKHASALDGVAVEPGFQSIQAIKDIRGVAAAGRRVMTPTG